MVQPKVVLVPPASGCTGCRCYRWWQTFWSQARHRYASDCSLWCRMSVGLLLSPHSTTAQDKDWKTSRQSQKKKLETVRHETHISARSSAFSSVFYVEYDSNTVLMKELDRNNCRLAERCIHIAVLQSIICCNKKKPGYCWTVVLPEYT